MAGAFNGADTQLQRILSTKLIDDHVISVDNLDEETLAYEMDMLMEAEDGIVTGYVTVMTAVAVMKVQGNTTKDILERFPVLSERRLERLMKTEAYGEIMTTITAQVVETSKRFLNTAAMKATKSLVELLDSPNEKVKLSAANSVLDRVGLKSAEVHIIEDKREDITSKDWEENMKILNDGLDEVQRSLEITMVDAESKEVS